MGKAGPETPRKQRAETTKKNIFTAALGLFAQTAYEEVSVSDICAAAGVSVGAFYHHFKSKEDVLSDGYLLFDRAAEEAWAAYHAPSPRAAVLFLVETQLHSMGNMGVVAAAQYFKNQLSSEKALAYIVRRDRFFYQTLLGQCGAMLGEAGSTADPVLLVGDILSVTRGVIYDWCLHKGGYQLVEKGLRLTQMCIGYYLGSNAG